MVGGRVIETIPCVVDGEARVWINVRGTRGEHGNTCAVYVEDAPSARSVSEGDSLWWQGSWAFWTPRVGGFSDYRLRRIGCSGVSRPEEADTAESTPRFARAWGWM